MKFWLNIHPSGVSDVFHVVPVEEALYKEDLWLPGILFKLYLMFFFFVVFFFCSFNNLNSLLASSPLFGPADVHPLCSPITLFDFYFFRADKELFISLLSPFLSSAPLSQRGTMRSRGTG